MTTLEARARARRGATSTSFDGDEIAPRDGDAREVDRRARLARARERLRDGAGGTGATRSRRRPTAWTRARALGAAFVGACALRGVGVADGATALTKGVARNGFVSASAYKYYKVNVACVESAQPLTLELTTSNGNADLYVSRTSQPSTGTYEHRSVNTGNALDSVTISSPTNGYYYVSVYGTLSSTYKIRVSTTMFTGKHPCTGFRITDSDVSSVGSGSGNAFILQDALTVSAAAGFTADLSVDGNVILGDAYVDSVTVKGEMKLGLTDSTYYSITRQPPTSPTSNPGGALALIGANATNGGGSVTVLGGTGGTGAGGAVTVEAGAATSGTGGTLTLRGGTSNAGTGGDVVIDAGDSTTQASTYEGVIHIGPNAASYVRVGESSNKQVQTDIFGDLTVHGNLVTTNDLVFGNSYTSYVQISTTQDGMFHQELRAPKLTGLDAEDISGTPTSSLTIDAGMRGNQKHVIIAPTEAAAVYIGSTSAKVPISLRQGASTTDYRLYANSNGKLTLTSAAGQDVVIEPEGSTSGSGGSVTLTGGATTNASTASGGDVTITSGQAPSGSSNGDVTIDSAPGGGGTAGILTLRQGSTGGDRFVASATGAVTVSSASNQDVSVTAGGTGSIALTPGDDLTVDAGDDVSIDAAGSLFLKQNTKNILSWNDAGAVTLSSVEDQSISIAPHGSSSAAGGAVSLTGGGASGASDAGGAVEVVGGTASGTTSVGGGASLLSGDGTSSHGAVLIDSAPGSGSAGTLTLRQGSTGGDRFVASATGAVTVSSASNQDVSVTAGGTGSIALTPGDDLTVDAGDDVSIDAAGSLFLKQNTKNILSWNDAGAVTLSSVEDQSISIAPHGSSSAAGGAVSLTGGGASGASDAGGAVEVVGGTASGTTSVGGGASLLSGDGTSSHGAVLIDSAPGSGSAGTLTLRQGSTGGDRFVASATGAVTVSSASNQDVSVTAGGTGSIALTPGDDLTVDAGDDVSIDAAGSLFLKQNTKNILSWNDAGAVTLSSVEDQSISIAPHGSSSAAGGAVSLTGGGASGASDAGGAVEVVGGTASGTTSVGGGASLLSGDGTSSHGAVLIDSAPGSGSAGTLTLRQGSTGGDRFVASATGAVTVSSASNQDVSVTAGGTGSIALTPGDDLTVDAGDDVSIDAAGSLFLKQNTKNILSWNDAGAVTLSSVEDQSISIAPHGSSSAAGGAVSLTGGGASGASDAGGAVEVVGGTASGTTSVGGGASLLSGDGTSSHGAVLIDSAPGSGSAGTLTLRQGSTGGDRFVASATGAVTVSSASNQDVSVTAGGTGSIALTPGDDLTVDAGDDVSIDAAGSLFLKQNTKNILSWNDAGAVTLSSVEDQSISIAPHGSSSAAGGAVSLTGGGASGASDAGGAVEVVGGTASGTTSVGGGASLLSGDGTSSHGAVLIDSAPGSGSAGTLTLRQGSTGGDRFVASATGAVTVSSASNQDVSVTAGGTGSIALTPGDDLTVDAGDDVSIDAAGSLFLKQNTKNILSWNDAGAVTLSSVEDQSISIAPHGSSSAAGGAVSLTGGGASGASDAGGAVEVVGGTASGTTSVGGGASLLSGDGTSSHGAVLIDSAPGSGSAGTLTLRQGSTGGDRFVASATGAVTVSSASNQDVSVTAGGTGSIALTPGDDLTVDAGDDVSIDAAGSLFLKQNTKNILSWNDAGAVTLSSVEDQSISIAPHGSSSAAGGAVSLTGGGASGASDAGGAVEVVGGTASGTTSVGGGASLLSGDGTSSHGAVLIDSAPGSGSAGTLTLRQGSTGGDRFVASATGAVTVSSASNQDVSVTAGGTGSIALTPGDDLTVDAGDDVSIDAAGSLFLKQNTKNILSWNDAGAVTLSSVEDQSISIAPHGSSSAAGGAVSLTGGGASGASDAGGAVEVVGGTASGTTSVGGGASLLSGDGTSSHGAVLIDSAPGSGSAGTLTLRQGSTGGDRFVASATGAVTVNTASGRDLTLKTGDTARVTVDSTGNIGVGTSTPSKTLDVTGTGRVSTTFDVGTVLTVSGTSTLTGDVTMSGAATVGTTLDVTQDVTIGAGGDLNFAATGATHRQMINLRDGAAAFGIGTQTDTTYFRSPGNFAFYEDGSHNDADFNAGTGNARLVIKSGGNVGIGLTNPSYKLDVTGTGRFTGALSKGSGSFLIDHPLPEMKETHDLYHSFIEGPRADLIYRGKVRLTNGRAVVDLDEVSDMTSGTFTALNRDVQCFTSNESDWDAVRGSINGATLTIESQNSASTAVVSWLVIGERQDEHMYETEWTDENGRVIPEQLKKNATA